MNLCVFLLSAAVLTHEICLLRALAIAHQGHAASFVVSVALVGFGAAGTLLAIVPRLRRPATVAVAASLYAVLVPLSLRVADGVGFDVMVVGWDPSAWLDLLALQAVFLLPFVAAATAIWVALALRAHRPGRTYAANLLGSGLGALVAAPLLASGPPEQVMVQAAIVAALAAAAVPGRPAKIVALVGIGVVALLGAPRLTMSPFKDLPATPNAQILETRYGPHGRVDRVRSPSIHDAPGLSLRAATTLPPQDGLFVDGHRIAAIDLEPSAYGDDTVHALPYLLAAPARTVLLGVGPDLLRADLVVDADRNRLELAGVEGRALPPRAWLERSTDEVDLLIAHLSAGDPIQEDPVFTVEALGLALRRARMVALGSRLTTPPRPGLKLLALADAVTPHVVAVRSMDRLAVVLLRDAPTESQLRKVDAFGRARGFDRVRPPPERGPTPFHETATPLTRTSDDYPYDVRLPTDARPYVHKTFRWARLPDVLDRDAIPYVPWRFVMRIVAFVQIVLIGLLLLLGPLLLSRAARAPAPLFLGLGLGYMLLEMAFLSQATVRLGGMTLAAAAVIGGFLVGSGFGSLAGERLGHPLRRAALVGALLALPALALLPDEAWAIGLVCALVAFPLGMPFPAALSRLAPPSVPWAFAVNGLASVAAAAAAPLLSTTVGIPVTAALAVLLYLGVASRASSGVLADRSLR